MLTLSRAGSGPAASSDDFRFLRRHAQVLKACGRIPRHET